MNINSLRVRVGILALSSAAAMALLAAPAKADFKTAMDAYTGGAPAAARAVIANPTTPQEKAFLAHMLLRGLGGGPDLPRGEALLREAAQAGYGPAQSTLASMLATGGVIEKNLPSAINWASRAAEQNRPEAMALLARLLDDDLQTERAERWRKAAASYGDPAALLALAKADQAAGAADPARMRSAYTRFSLAAAFAAQQFRRTKSEADALLSHEAQAHRASLDLSLPETELAIGIEEANAELKAIVQRLKALHTQ